MDQATGDTSPDYLTSLINSMADGVIAVDASGKIEIYNGAALNILDLNSSIHGMDIGTVLEPIDKDGGPINISTLVSKTTVPTINESMRLQYGDGSIANLYFSISPVYHATNTHRHGYVIVLRDITRTKSLEEERAEFISVVSHELRTPVAIAEGNISNAEYMADKTGDLANIKVALKESHKQILFLADMVNDLSTLSRAERGKLTLELEPIQPQKLLEELVESYAAEAAKKNLTLKTAPSAHLEPFVSSRLYVREILQNFVTNALKYTEKGSVTISAKPGEHGMEFSVSDTGIGISRGDQARVFEKFFRSEDFRTRQTSGTGLGLYVTMKLVKLIHADISLTSKLNHGSTFTVTVPNLEPEVSDKK